MNTEAVAGSAAAKGLEFCNEIFILERTFEGKDLNGQAVREPLTAEERYIQRLERSKPVVDAFFAWLGELRHAGGTKLSKAVGYCLHEKEYLKEYLYRFLENGSIRVDNNRAENAIRPFVVGRKNWLFSTSPKGAKASAIIYSLAATAVANGLNAEEYFTQLFRSQLRLPWEK